MPLPCPTCASPLLPLPAVLVSGPALPDVAECERGHQVEALGQPGQHGPELAYPVPLAPVTDAVTPATVPWQHPDADVFAEVQRFLGRLGRLEATPAVPVSDVRTLRARLLDYGLPDLT